MLAYRHFLSPDRKSSLRNTQCVLLVVKRRSCLIQGFPQFYQPFITNNVSSKQTNKQTTKNQEKTRFQKGTQNGAIFLSHDQTAVWMLLELLLSLTACVWYKVSKK